ncbi:MAG: hypothetical protein V4598_17655 [Bdellovibrionota bacterium]
MKLLTLITFMSCLIGTAWSGPRLIIEHPRYPFLQKDIYTVACEKECAVKISSTDPFSGSTAKPLLQEKIRALITEYEKGEFPVFSESPKILYDLQVEDGTKKFRLKVGYPRSYRNQEYTKFNLLVERIEELKFIMRKSEKGP